MYIRGDNGNKSNDICNKYLAILIWTEYQMKSADVNIDKYLIFININMN